MMIKQLNHPSCPRYFEIRTIPNLPFATQFYPGQTLKLKDREVDGKIGISVMNLDEAEFELVLLPTETIGNLKK